MVSITAKTYAGLVSHDVNKKCFHFFFQPVSFNHISIRFVIANHTQIPQHILCHLMKLYHAVMLL